ncbi:hypothetical protein CJ208_07100 [Finegoldia magna]|uniref:Uncharacterized protein n=1 Tax=Finegoldia magna TaxID=1260 RepID=A0A2N6SRW2_FINMA|nr:hypothetical protein CJ208_07100 [Finegoldia magna]
MYFGIQKPLHPYSGFWGSGQRGVIILGKGNKSCKTLNRLRKLVNSNLEILKLEARFAQAVKF